MDDDAVDIPAFPVNMSPKDSGETGQMLLLSHVLSAWQTLRIFNH